MSVEQIELTVDGATYEGRLNTPDEATGAGVVVLPGAGHGPFGDIFDIIAYELAKTGAQVLRFESWESHEELGEKTLAELHEEMDAAVERLQSNGCSTISVLAKSFGGGIALTYVPDAVERLVLWAPSIDVAEDPNVGNRNRPLGEFAAEEGLKTGAGHLGRIDVPVRILRGDEDPGVSREDCRRIVDALQDGEVTEIPGETHSFNRNRTAIVERTLGYLAADS